MTNEYKEMKIWFKDDSQIPKTVKEMMNYEIKQMDLREVKRKSSARFKGVMSLLAIEGAKDFDTTQYLENAKQDQDHVFPKSMRQNVDQSRFINSVLNMTWMSTVTNRRIKKAKKPSIYIEKFISENYNGDEKQFIEILKSHMINEKAYESMQKDNFKDFLVEREREIISKIAKKLCVKEFRKEPKMLKPGTPFSNKKLLWDTLRTCNGYVYWIDKYFSKAGLEAIIDADLNPSKIREIKILMSSKKVNDKLRKNFKNFKTELENQGINCELRMITDPAIDSAIHDRWILGDNCAFNVASTDVIARGQYSEIKATTNRPPFDSWWKKSENIISQIRMN
jgi:hypothetical protein